jgi:hypothetical protein
VLAFKAPIGNALKAAQGHWQSRAKSVNFFLRLRGEGTADQQKSCSGRREVSRLIAIHGDEGGDDAAALAARMGQHIAHEVDAAASNRRSYTITRDMTRSRADKPVLDGHGAAPGRLPQDVADVPDNSVPLILIDPPYEEEDEEEAGPLYESPGSGRGFAPPARGRLDRVAVLSEPVLPEIVMNR